jgi:hypothetical protein
MHKCKNEIKLDNGKNTANIAFKQMPLDDNHQGA